MIWFRLVIVTVLWTGIGMTMAQDTAASLPDIWNEIQQEVAPVADEFPNWHSDREKWVWETAERIARDHDRQTIDVLFKSVAELDKLPTRNEPKYLKAWMKGLASHVIVEIADPDGRRGLRPKEGTPGGDVKTIAILAMDSYYDDASRDWLFDVVLDTFDNLSNDTSQREPLIFWAFQLLRGYEPDEAMREASKRALLAKPARSDRVGRLAHGHLQAVLSSWEYAASLEDPATRTRYLVFESHLWRFYAFAPKMSRNAYPEFAIPAARLLDEWQPGDERFLLHIFENPSSTSIEGKIALHMTDKLPDAAVPKLQAIAESESPLAPLARQAVQQIERRREQSEE